MNLDDPAGFVLLDSANMLAQIDQLPDQLAQAWQLGSGLALPTWPDLHQIVIAGVGGSAIGADLLAAYVEPFCSLPVYVHRDYGLPGWASGPATLVIAASHSGITEETLSSFEQAVERGCRCLAVTTGGKLAQAAEAAAIPLWNFEHRGQPRAAVGFSFGLLLAALGRLNLLPDLPAIAAELDGAIAAMRQQQPRMAAEVPAAQNPAKRQAGQLVGRMVAVLAAGLLAPVARRWKSQLSEVAKAWAQFETLPEADHNTLAGTQHPEELFSRLIVVFLQSPSDHPRNALRTQLTRQRFMLEGLSTDILTAQGPSRLAHMWTMLHFGDYLSYYLAMAYGVDPTPVEAIADFKAELQAYMEED
jgi:glucose/mannose-6-phosphate isomerase